MIFEYASVISCHQVDKFLKFLGIEFDFIFLCPGLLKYYLQLIYLNFEDYFVQDWLSDGHSHIKPVPENHN